MKTLFFAFLLGLLSLSAVAQNMARWPGYGYEADRLRATKRLEIPLFTGNPKVDGLDSLHPALGFKLGDSLGIWIFDPQGGRWHRIGSGGGGVNGNIYAGFGLYYVNDSTLAVDSSALADIFLRITDTASRWVSDVYRIPGRDSLYFRFGEEVRAVYDSSGGGGSSTDTTWLSNRINLKLNISDTAAMLAPYLRKTDTLALSSRINRKWDTYGNGGLSNTQNFIGTTDSVWLNFRVNNLPAGRIKPDGSVYLGVGAGRYDTLAHTDNVGIGYEALYNAVPSFGGITGGASVAIGFKALHSQTTISGGNNVAIGWKSMYNNTTGYANVYIGLTSGISNTSGLGNTGVGVYAGNANTTGYSNLWAGQRAGQNNTIGIVNVALGREALNYASGVVDYVSIVDGGSGYSSPPTVIFSAPDATMEGGLSGGDIQATGTAVLDGDSVIGVTITNPGLRYSIATVSFTGGGGSGAVATVATKSADWNVAVGGFALAGLHSGFGNIGIGRQAGYGVSGGNEASKIDSFLTLVGYYASRDNSIAQTTALKRSFAIGYNAKVAASDVGILGDANIKIGIRTSAPTRPLHVVGYGLFTDTLQAPTHYGNELLLQANPTYSLITMKTSSGTTQGQIYYAHGFNNLAYNNTIASGGHIFFISGQNTAAIDSNGAWARKFRIGTTSYADSNAVLDIVSPKKGVLFPRLTTAQISGIINPASGLFLYNTDSASITWFNGGTWVYPGTGSGSSAPSRFGYPGEDDEMNENRSVDIATNNRSLTFQIPGEDGTLTIGRKYTGNIYLDWNSGLRTGDTEDWNATNEWESNKIQMDMVRGVSTIESRAFDIDRDKIRLRFVSDSLSLVNDLQLSDTATRMNYRSTAITLNDSLSMTPFLGKVNIDSLRTTVDSSSFKPMSFNAATGEVRQFEYWPGGGSGGITGVTDGSGFDLSVSGSNLSVTTSLTSGSVPFIGSSGALSQDNAAFFWDATNDRLGIGTNSPQARLHVANDLVRLPNGSVFAADGPGIAFDSYPNDGLASNGGNLAIWQNDVIACNISDANKEFRFAADYFFSWSSATHNNSVSDTRLSREAAGVVSLTENGSSGGKLLVATGTSAGDYVLQAEGDVFVHGEVNLKNTSGQVTVAAPESVTDYTLTLPAAAPLTANEVMSVNASGIGTFRKPHFIALESNQTTVGNVGTGEDNLMTYAVPASTLATNGDYIEFEMVVTFAANANAKQVKVYFGSTQLYASGSQAQNSGNMVITGKIIRTGAATQRISLSAQNNTTLFVDETVYTTATETLSGALTLKMTGEAVSNNDITQVIQIVNYINR